MEIDWTKAPYWAKYAAMDSNGQWNYYSCKPYVSDHEWGTDEEYMSIDGVYDNWKSSLIVRPC